MSVLAFFVSQPDSVWRSEKYVIGCATEPYNYDAAYRSLDRQKSIAPISAVVKYFSWGVVPQKPLCNAALRQKFVDHVSLWMRRAPLLCWLME